MRRKGDVGCYAKNECRKAETDGGRRLLRRGRMPNSRDKAHTSAFAEKMNLEQPRGQAIIWIRPPSKPQQIRPRK